MVIDDTFIYEEDIDVTETTTLRFPKLFKKDKRYSVSKGKDSYGVLPLFCAFDIETTNDPETKSAYMYIATFAVATTRQCFLYHFRKWHLFTAFLDALASHYELTAKQHIVCYVANLGFEFQFIRKRIQWDTSTYGFFAKEHRKPLLATTSNYIEFREALSISGGNLDYLSQHYTHTKKAVGELDYTKKRNSTTPLDPVHEMHYINSDVVILCEFSHHILTTYVAHDRKFPLTKTGLLRSYLKTKTKELVKDYDAYLTYIQSLFPNYNDYIFYYDKLFRGGYVHANIYHVGDIIPDVDSYDETSAYPAMMLLMDNYPVTPFKDTSYPYEAWLYYCIEHYACIIDITFTDIYRTSCHSIESDSKCVTLDAAEIDNGRIKSAHTMRVLLTELDFLTYQDFYAWQSYTINSLRIAKRGRLPKPLLECLKHDYIYKDTLKRTGKSHTNEYAHYKSQVNSYYGMTVTRISLDNWRYTDEWTNEERSTVDYTKETSKALLSPYWGFWITANARRALLRVCRAIEDVSPNGVIYNDTDSIKCLHDPATALVIESYNQSIQERKQAIGLTDEAFRTLGCFDFECNYKKFKTLGAKRYLVEYPDGKLEATIAGFPKSAIQNVADPFEAFSVNGMSLTPEQSTKHTALYNDDVTDTIIDGERMVEYSSVYIYEIPFTMSLSKEFYINVLSTFETKGKKL